MAESITLTHPELNGRTVEAKTEEQARVLEKSGWTRESATSEDNVFGGGLDS